MPFGFWVLGNASEILCALGIRQRVSNAFRLLGSGEQTKRRRDACFTEYRVSNAFRLLGSGELGYRSQQG